MRHIVALRGDPPEAGAKYQPHPGGLSRCHRAGRRPEGGGAVRHLRRRLSRGASELVDRAISISRICRRKVDAGADRAITQFFFSADCFFRFRDAVAAAGMDIEIVPGILPVSNVATTRRFAGSCGASIPEWLDRTVRRPRRPAVGAPADRRDRRGRAVRPALCRRGPPLPFLHAQPGRAQLRHLPPAGRAREMSAAADSPRRSGQAHPDQGRRLWHADPGRAAAERRLLRRARPAEGPARQQRPAQHHPARHRPQDLRAFRRLRRRHPRHQYLQRQLASARPIMAPKRWCARDQPRSGRIIREVADR